MSITFSGELGIITTLCQQDNCVIATAMLSKLGRSLSPSRWTRSFSVTKSLSIPSHPDLLSKVKHSSNEDSPATGENGGHYGMRYGEVLHGRYTVVGKLGQGQYSSVWLAEDSR
jgi:hypothetical protein